MSKNLTRKGLALGAVVALGTTLIAGTPAQAVTTGLTTTSSFGTSYKVLLGTDFNFATTSTGQLSGNDDLKFAVEGALLADIKDVASGTSGTQLNSRVVTALDNSSTNYTAGSTVRTVDAAAKTLVIDAVDPSAQYSQLKLGLSSAVTTTTTLKLTPFSDSVVADDKITAGEVVGAPITITFVKPSEVTATTTLNALNTGVAGSLKAYVTLSGDINLAQMVSGNSLTTVGFKTNGSDSYSGSASVAAAYDSASGKLLAASSSVTPAANDVITAQAKLDGTASGSAAIASATAGAATVTSVTDPAPAKGANVRLNSGNAWYVRTGATSVQLKSTVKVTNADSDTNQAAPAGVPVRVTVTENSANLVSTITVGGQTLKSASSTDTAESVSYDSVTNADGQVVIDLASSAGTLDDTVTVKVQALGTSAWVAASNVATLTWSDPTISTGVVRQGLAGKNAVISVKKGSSYSVSYVVTDNFGAPIADSTTATKKRAVRLTASGITGVAIDQTVAVSNGVATFNITDTAAATGNYNLVAQLQERNSGDDAWVDGSNTSLTTVVYVTDAQTVGFLSANKSAGTATTTSDFAAGALNLVSNTNTAIAVPANGAAFKISGSVLLTDGTAGKGVAVTLTGAGLEFVAHYGATADKILSPGSITVYTDASGNYEAYAWSHKAGEVAITVASGSVTKTVTPEWDAVASNVGSAIAITAPAYAAPGSTQNISVALTDQFGNAVDTTNGTGETFSITVSGSGISGTIPVDTNADGVAKFYQLIGSADSGSFTVTVKYDRDGASHTYAAITKTATVTIGSAAVVAKATVGVSGGTKKFNVSVSNAAGKTVVVKVAGKFVTSFSGSASKKTVAVKATKGSKKVTVYVGGKLVATKTVTVK